MIFSEKQRILKKVSLNELISYLLTRNKHYEKQQTFQMRQLILALKNHTIDNLKKQFIAQKNKIPITIFLKLMKSYIEAKQVPDFEIYYELVKLFEEIDIDGNGNIEWQEMMEYFSSTSWIQLQPYLKNNLLPLNCMKYENVTFSFRQNQKNTRRRNFISKIVEIQKLQCLGILQKRSNRLTYIDMDGTELSSNILKINHNDILSLDYSNDENLFGILSCNHKVTFIEKSQIQKNYGIVTGIGDQISIVYLKVHGLWALINIHHTIQIFSSPKKVKLTQKIVFKPHSQPISGIKQLTFPLALCTSSFDGLIRIWSLQVTKQLLVELNHHSILKNKGIKGIDTYNTTTQSYLCSWQFSTEISIWLPSRSLTTSYQGELKGHLSIIQDCKFIQHSEQIISMDRRNAVKVWNIVSRSCLQNWNLEKQQSKLFILNSCPYVLFYSNNLQFYKIKTKKCTNPQKNVNVSDFLTLEICQAYQYFVMLTANSLRIINIYDAHLISKIHPQLQEELLVAICLKIERRIFMASNLGFIYYLKTDDGLIIKRYCIAKMISSEEMDPLEIKFIHYHSILNVLLVISQIQSNKCIICTFQHTADYQFILIKKFQGDQHHLKYFMHLQKLQFFILGSDDGLITIWNYEKINVVNSLHIEKLCKNRDIGVLCGLSKHQQYAVIVALCSNGYIVTASLSSEGEWLSIEVMKLPCEGKMHYSGCQLIQIKQENVMHLVPKINAELQCISNDNQEKSLLLLYTCTDQGNIILFNLQLHNIESPVSTVLKMKDHRIRELKKSSCSKQLYSFTEIKQSELTAIDRYRLIYGKILSMQKVSNIICCYCEKGNFLMVGLEGNKIAEWNMSIDCPNFWHISYPKLKAVLSRLESTHNILRQISVPHQKQNDTKQFLINRYCSEQDIQFLKITVNQMKLYSENDKDKIQLNQQKDGDEITRQFQIFSKVNINIFSQPINRKILHKKIKITQQYDINHKKNNQIPSKSIIKFHKSVQKKQQIQNRIRRVLSQFKIKAQRSIGKSYDKDIRRNSQIDRNFEMKLGQGDGRHSYCFYKMKTPVKQMLRNFKIGNKDRQLLIKSRKKF